MSSSLRGNLYCSKLVIVELNASGLKHKIETVEVPSFPLCLEAVFYQNKISTTTLREETNNFMERSRVWCAVNV